jgi:hypothetical protein
VLPDDIPTTGLKAFISDLAKRHTVSYVRDGNSALAASITHLAGDDMQPDDTEQLVIALRKARIIDGPTMVLLLGRYFDEIRALSSQKQLSVLPASGRKE